MQEALWLENLPAALRWVDEYVALAPTSSRAWLHRGDVLYSLERTRDALEAYSSAIRFAPPGAQVAAFKAGLCAQELGDLWRSADLFLQSLRLDPLSLSAAESLGEVAGLLEDDDLAQCAALVANAQRGIEAYEVPQSAYKALAPPDSTVPTSPA
jgi:tetratricopeptide (TPR) repeat protein